MAPSRLRAFGGHATRYEKDRRILSAVWRAWADGRPLPTYRDLRRLAGLTLGPTWEHCDRLIEEGWLVRADNFGNRTLRPGPRFAGLDGDEPLEAHSYDG